MGWKTIETLHANGVRVADALAALGVTAEIVETLESSPTAARAAEQLDIEIGQVCNSLVFDADGEALLILASGGHKVDTDRVAAEIGATTIHRPDADFVRLHTGQPIGGVAPVGHPIRSVGLCRYCSVKRYRNAGSPPVFWYIYL
jgi:prolyl-tRNA editing enzyme YbaK/EbsC (Cys-tRNA(Pro) deacylase)